MAISLFNVKWKKDVVLVDSSGISEMNADSVARFIRDNPNSWIIRNYDGTINKIVKREPIITPIKL